MDGMVIVLVMWCLMLGGRGLSAFGEVASWRGSW